MTMDDANSYDVVVVGAGVAGLTAAIAAAESGARVAVLERSSEAETGGNTRYTEAFLRMKSQTEPSDGLGDALLSDFMGHPDPGLIFETTDLAENRSPLIRAHQVVDPDYVERFVSAAGETLDWLSDHGMAFAELPTPFLTVSTTRMAPVGGGQALVDTLGKEARSLGVTFHFETTARSLETDDREEVVGVNVRAHRRAGIFSGRVVLATGGYQGNAEMMVRYHGDGALTTRPVARGGNYNRGEGIEMGISIGAATAGNFSLFHAEPIDPRSAIAEAAVFCFPYGILVNKTGKRFVDEARGPVDAWYERTSRDIHAQVDGLAYAILDREAMGIPMIRSGIRTDQPAIVSESIAGLAEHIGVPPSNLERTVSEYNDACTQGAFDHRAPDGLATDNLTPPKSNWARPIKEAPFKAWPIIAANVFTFGGLKTNSNAQVLSSDGAPIVGLYAAGEMTGLYYSNYTGSTSVLRGAVFGRIAGREAASDCRKE